MLLLAMALWGSPTGPGRAAPFAPAGAPVFPTLSLPKEATLAETLRAVQRATGGVVVSERLLQDRRLQQPLADMPLPKK